MHPSSRCLGAGSYLLRALSVGGARRFLWRTVYLELAAKGVAMDLEIGSNILYNTNGILRLEGDDQITFEKGIQGDPLLLTMNLYSSQGDHMARLEKNSWISNPQDRYAVIITPPSSLRLREASYDVFLMEANMVDSGRIAVPNGHFYTHRGTRVYVTPQLLRVGILTMANIEIDGAGGAVELAELNR